MTTQAEKRKLLEDGLPQFCGTENWHRFSAISSLVITDGVKYLADTAGAYWLLDVIASYQRRLRGQEFQTWILNVTTAGSAITGHRTSAVVTCEDGNGNKLLSQAIPYTDFPLDTIKLFCIDGVILLPNEN